MRDRDNTDGLIADLAEQVVCEPSPARLEPALRLASVTGLALAVALAFAVFGAADGLARTLAGAWFYRKVACMALLAAGSSVVLRDLARPGCARTRAEALLPGAAALAAVAAADSSGLSLGGRMPLSVPTCVGAIALLSLPGLALMLLAVRVRGAATRPRLAGATAGLLAGALGGAAYALACHNDGGLFVALWYGAAVCLVAGLGAGLGRRALAW